MRVLKLVKKTNLIKGRLHRIRLSRKLPWSLKVVLQRHSRARSWRRDAFILIVRFMRKICVTIVTTNLLEQSKQLSVNTQINPLTATRDAWNATTPGRPTKNVDSKKYEKIKISKKITSCFHFWAYSKITCKIEFSN